MKTEEYFIFLDGDQVGKRMEQVILKSDISEVEELSKGISSQFHELQLKMTSLGIKVIIAAGDNIIGVGSQEKIVSSFKHINGSVVSISAGVGWELLDAYLALRYAKSLGGGQIVESSRILEPNGRNTLVFQLFKK